MYVKLTSCSAAAPMHVTHVHTHTNTPSNQSILFSSIISLFYFNHLNKCTDNNFIPMSTEPTQLSSFFSTVSLIYFTEAFFA